MTTREKLLTQNIARFKARMASANNKDELRRSIKACEAQLEELKKDTGGR